MKRSVLTVIAIMASALPYINQAAIRRVVATVGEKSGDWALAAVAGDNAASVIQAQLDASSDGDVVLLKSGSYVLTEELSLTTDGVTLRSDDGSGKLARKSTLLIGGYPATQNRLVYLSGKKTIVEGLTLTNGYVYAEASGSGKARSFGGGAYLDDCGAGSGLRSCDVVGCTAWYQPYVSGDTGNLGGGGGGVYICKSGVIEDCLIAANTAFSGGGVYLDGNQEKVAPLDSIPRVTHSTLLDNVIVGVGYYDSYGNGAALFSCLASSIDNSSVMSNRCNTTGARSRNLAIGNLNGFLLVSNCLFCANHLGTRAGNYTIGSNYAVNRRQMVVGCTFYDETPATSLLGNIECHDRNTVIACGKPFVGNETVRNSLFIRNTNYCLGSDQMAKPHAENCTFIGNNICLYSNGGGVVASRTNVVVNCLFYGNVNDICGANAGNSSPIALFMSNCCVRASSLTVSGNHSFGLVVTNNFNIIYDDAKREAFARDVIKFVDAAKDDYRLLTRSGLLDKALKLDWMSAAVDREGKPRCLDIHARPLPSALPDIGCYECAFGLPGFTMIVR